MDTPVVLCCLLCIAGGQDHHIPLQALGFVDGAQRAFVQLSAHLTIL